MEYKFNLEGKTYNIKIEQKKDYYLAIIDNQEPIKINAQTLKLSNSQTLNCLSLVIDGKITTVYIAFDRGKGYIFVDGNYFTLELEKEKSGKAKDTGSSGKETTISSPMPGTIVKIPVSIGTEIEVGTTLAIVEAMKMQNELKASIKGRVKKINFSAGMQVDALQTIVELEAL